jgi:hypothetical protein
MAVSISLFLKGTGAVLMLHAAYSCMHYRSILQDLDLVTTSSSGSDGQHQDGTTTETDTSEETETMMIPPIDVYFEVVLAFILILLGELIGIGSLQSVELVPSSSSSSSSSSSEKYDDEVVVKRKPLAAPAYRTRDFDIYNNRSKALLHRVTKND